LIQRQLECGELDCSEKVPKANRLYRTPKGIVEKKKVRTEKRVFPCQNEAQCDGEKNPPTQEYLLIFVSMIYRRRRWAMSYPIMGGGTRSGLHVDRLHLVWWWRKAGWERD